MKAYTYKDSGIEWLGEIPTHWTYDKLFRLCDNVGSGGTPQSTNQSYYDGDIFWVQSGDLTDGYVYDTKKKINDLAIQNSSAKVFAKDTLLVAMYGATIGKVGIMTFEGAINQACCALDFSSKVIPQFSYYFMLNARDYLITQAYGGGQQNISQETLKQLHLFYPPVEEQKSIANFLDKAIDRIDRIICIKQEQIESLDSYFTKELTKVITRGIGENVLQDTSCFWLPKIKDGWRLLPLKRLLKTKLKYGANEAAVDENIDDPRYIRITDFDRNGKLRSNTFKSLSPEVADPYLLTEGDVLFARSGATVGKTFIFKDYDGLACFAGYLIKAECDKNKLLPDFLYYFTKSLSYSEWKDLIFTQATIQNIGADKYQYLNVPVPSVEEQNKIVEFIKVLEEATNNAKSNINSQIETLQSYRKSLIHECVTGKKQVTNKIE